MAGFFDALDAALPIRADRILEVGIGEGEVMERLRKRYPDAAITGIDLPDPELQAEWRDRGLSTSVADALQLPFPDNTFDLCLAIEVLEHVPDPPGMLQEMARVATSTAVVSVPREPLWRAMNLARGSYIKELGNTPGHINHWSRSGFEQLVSHHFDIDSVASPIPWTVISANSRSETA